MNSSADSNRTGRRRYVWPGLLLICIGALLYLAWRTRSTGMSDVDLAQAQERTQKLGDKLAHALEQNTVKTLLPEVQALTTDYPRYAPARTLLAQVHLSAGEISQAYAALEACLQLDPQQTNVRELAGTVALKLGKPADAIAHYQAVVVQQPQLTRTRLLLAQALIEKGDLDAAEKQLLQTLALDASSAMAHALLADVFARQNKLPLALEQIAKAVTLTPATDLGHLTAHRRMQARLLRRDNRPSEALQALVSLPVKARIELPVMDDIAACYGMLGQPLQAARYYEERLTLDPTDDRVLARACTWYLQAGDKASARRMLDRLRAVNPRSSEIPELQAKLK